MNEKVTAVLNAIDGLKALMLDHAAGEPSLARAYRDDHKDYVQLENLIRDGKVSIAHRRAREMDSIVRDRLPEIFWKLTDGQAKR